MAHPRFDRARAAARFATQVRVAYEPVLHSDGFACAAHLPRVLRPRLTRALPVEALYG